MHILFIGSDDNEQISPAVKGDTGGFETRCTHYHYS